MFGFSRGTEGYARYGRAAQEAIYLIERPVFELGTGTRIGIGMGAGVWIPLGVGFSRFAFFSGFLLLDASWDSDTPVLFFMDYGRVFGTRGLEKRECNRGVLIRGWICEWVDRLGCCEVQHLCMR